MATSFSNNTLVGNWWEDRYQDKVDVISSKKNPLDTRSRVVPANTKVEYSSISKDSYKHYSIDNHVAPPKMKAIKSLGDSQPRVYVLLHTVPFPFSLVRNPTSCFVFIHTNTCTSFSSFSKDISAGRVIPQADSNVVYKSIQSDYGSFIKEEDIPAQDKSIPAGKV